MKLDYELTYHVTGNLRIALFTKIRKIWAIFENQLNLFWRAYFHKYLLVSVCFYK